MSEGLGRERAMQPAMQSLGGFTAPLMCERVRLGKMFSSRHVPVWQVPGAVARLTELLKPSEMAPEGQCFPKPVDDLKPVSTRAGRRWSPSNMIECLRRC